MKRNTVTLLPAARVKRIMQEDEDVGKMAGNVPLVIAKATELFLIELIKKTNGVAEEKKSKSVNLTHLLECVKQTPEFDFLQELVETRIIENPPDERKRTKKETDEPSPKKKKQTNNESSDN
ncbi:DNA polymerase epsilon subunit C [Entamoeba marina]